MLLIGFHLSRASNEFKSVQITRKIRGSQSEYDDNDDDSLYTVLDDAGNDAEDEEEKKKKQ